MITSRIVLTDKKKKRTTYIIVKLKHYYLQSEPKKVNHNKAIFFKLSKLLLQNIVYEIFI